jgi:hypothetical protein
MTTTYSWRKYLVLFPIIITACVLTLRLGGAPTGFSQANKQDWPDSRASQLIFFSVLEGLYRDGVSNDDVDKIIPPNKQGHPTFDRENFVYACPLCHPAFEAFRLYRQREPFYGLKARIDTFGPSLGADVSAQLHSPDPAKRREAIQGLIQHWVAERLDMMRLSDTERAEITSEMEKGRKQGMNGLKQPGQTSQTRTNCPICDGSFGACKLQPH